MVEIWLKDQPSDQLGNGAPTRARTAKRSALLPPCTTGSVRIRSNLDIKLGRVIGGVGNGELQIEGARRGAGTRQDARAESASHSSANFAGASIIGA
jgi:hypothetical protein